MFIALFLVPCLVFLFLFVRLHEKGEAKHLVSQKKPKIYLSLSIVFLILTIISIPLGTKNSPSEQSQKSSSSSSDDDDDDDDDDDESSSSDSRDSSSSSSETSSETSSSSSSSSSTSESSSSSNSFSQDELKENVNNNLKKVDYAKLETISGQFDIEPYTANVIIYDEGVSAPVIATNDFIQTIKALKETNGSDKFDNWVITIKGNINGNKTMVCKLSFNKEDFNNLNVTDDSTYEQIKSQSSTNFERKQE